MFYPLFLLMYNIVYANEISEFLTKFGIRGNMDGTVVNHMLNADDKYTLCYLQQVYSGCQQ